jgi:hypothetical protein
MDEFSWIDNSPLEEETSIHSDGGKFIPYPIIVRKLNRLSPHSWQTQNFHHFFFHTKDGKVKVSGSIEVVVEYNDRKRVLAGAATFYTEDYAPNEHWAATVKSLAICNAVLVIGKNFGWNLNPQEDQQQDTFSGPIPAQKAPRNNKVSVLTIPDKSIRLRYATAVAAKDETEVKRLEGIYNFNSTQ